MDFFSRKRADNLAKGYREEKGLKDGYCNRYACQAPLAAEFARFSMADHEYHTSERLYYCERCAMMFTKDDDSLGMRRRILIESADNSEFEEG